MDMATKQNKVALPLRVLPSDLKRLDDLAERMDLDRSEVARRALRNGIDGLESLTKVASNPIADVLLRLVNLTEQDPEQREEVRRVLTSLSQHKKSSKSRRKGATA